MGSGRGWALSHAPKNQCQTGNNLRSFILKACRKFDCEVAITTNKSEFSQAWAEYRRRWLAAFAIPLFFVTCYIISGVISADSRPWTGFLMAALVAYVGLYLGFIRWPCPRCGRRFSTPRSYGIWRSTRCPYCGLSRE